MVLRATQLYHRGIATESLYKLGGSVYLVKREYSGAIRRLLERFENPGLKWYELNIVV
jgi:hypothetical protein